MKREQGINPIRLVGAWTEGYALDHHILSSTYMGEDVYGHPLFDTTRTKLGEMLFQFKYRYKHDQLDSIMEEIIPFLDEWEALKNVDVVISVPPSKTRLYQPAEELGKAVALYIGKHYYNDVLVKSSNIQSKDLSGDKASMTGVFHLAKLAKRTYNVLIVDDLYSTGKSLKECVHALRTDKMVKDIYVLTITKTNR